MTIFDARAARVLSTVLLFLAVGAFIWGAHQAILVFLFAILFAYLVDPLVNLVGRTPLGKGSRARSILVVYLVLLAVLVVTFSLIGSSLVTEAHGLSTRLPSLIENVTSGQIAHEIGTRRGWSVTTQMRLEQFLSSHRDMIVAWAQEAGARLASLATNVVWLILIPILAIFFLRDGREFANTMIEAVDRRAQKQLLREVFQDLHEMLASYIRAQVTLAIISGVVYTVVLTAMRVPYSFVLGAIGGLLEFIPMVGPAVAAVTILGVAMMSGYQHVLWVLVFLGVWRLVQDYVVSPRVMGSRVELHPLAVLFGVLVGGEIAGVLGVYLSIPAMAAFRILWRRWQRYERSEKEARPVPVVGREFHLPL